MGLFDKIFGNRPKEPGRYEGGFKMLNGYTPHFTTWGGNVYESERIRSFLPSACSHAWLWY